MSILSQILPAPPVEPGRPALDVDAAALTGLDGRDSTYPYAPTALLHAIGALCVAAPDYGPYLASSLLAEQPSEADLFDTMCVLGQFLPTGAPAQPGDLLGADDTWAVAVSAGGPGVRIDGDGRRYELVALPDGPYHWRPSKARIIDPASKTGQFWGLALTRYRTALSRMGGASYFAGDFIAAALAHTSLPVERAALLATLCGELQPLAAATTLRPGTILLDEDEDRAALVVTDTGECRAAGTGNGPDFHRCDIPDSGCSWAWVPRIV